MKHVMLHRRVYVVAHERYRAIWPDVLEMFCQMFPCASLRFVSVHRALGRMYFRRLCLTKSCCKANPECRVPSTQSESFHKDKKKNVGNVAAVAETISQQSNCERSSFGG